MAKKSKAGKRVGWLRHFKVGDAVQYHGNMALGRDQGTVVAVRDFQGAVVQWTPTRRGSVMVKDMIHPSGCEHRQCKEASQGSQESQESPTSPQGEGEPTS